MSEVETLTSALAGRYTIDAEVGAGGMATVYRAREVKHERQVAIKVTRYARQGHGCRCCRSSERICRKIKPATAAGIRFGALTVLRLALTSASRTL